MDSLRKVRNGIINKFSRSNAPICTQRQQPSAIQPRSLLDSGVSVGEQTNDDIRLADQAERSQSRDGAATSPHEHSLNTHNTEHREVPDTNRTEEENSGRDAVGSTKSILSSTRRTRNLELNERRLSFFFGNQSGFQENRTAAAANRSDHSSEPTIDLQTDHSIVASGRTGESERPNGPEHYLLAPAEQVVRTGGDRRDRGKRSEADRADDEMTSNRCRLPQITLELPSDPRAVDQKLQIFEALAAKAGLADEDKLIILNSAIESSAFKERMAEVIEVADLASYDRLKKALTEAIKLDLDERYSMVFRAGRRDPLATYNQLRALCPTQTDSQLLPLLKPHLPQYLYVQLQNASFTEQSLKQRLVEHARTASRGIQSYEEDRELYENVEMQKLREGQELVSRQLRELGDVLRPKAQSVNSVEQVVPVDSGQPAASDPLAGLTSAINRLINQVSSQPNGGRSSRSNRQNNSDSECYSHRRFGTGAYKCKTFCSRFDRNIYCIPAGQNTFMRADAPGAANHQQPPTFSLPPPPYVTPSPISVQPVVQPAAQPPPPQTQPAGSFSFQQLIDFTNAIRQFAGTNQPNFNE